MIVDMDMMVGLLAKAVVTSSDTIATRIKAYKQYESAKAVMLPCAVNVRMKIACARSRCIKKLEIENRTLKEKAM